MTNVTQIPSTTDRMIVEVHYANLTPEQVFDAFTTADGLLRWWPPVAETDARVGGAYHVRWIKQNIDLRGNYIELERGRRLVFTWNWDHEPDVPSRIVEIDFAPEGGGTHITLTHGYYAAGDTEERQGHIDGWLYYLERLGQLGE
jgi:uncharacterized protein YndB with AHSA1/START domain